jgi:hypothetical protein
LDRDDHSWRSRAALKSDGNLERFADDNLGRLRPVL